MRTVCFWLLARRIITSYVYSAGKLPAEELASLTVFFITIAMDLECPPARKRDVMAALEFTGRCIPRATSEGRPSSIVSIVLLNVT